MTSFTFNPLNQAECDFAIAVIAQIFPASVTRAITSLDDVTSTAVTNVTNVTNVMPATDTPTEGAPDPTNPDAIGMVWDGEIHSTPPKLKKNGEWVVRNGAKDKHAAAVAAHKAGGVVTPATTMPAGAIAPQAPAATMPEPTPAVTMPEPAAPEQTAPVAPITYEAMSQRFIDHLGDGGLIGDYELVYNDLGINHADLQTNQTSIQRLWSYMDALEANKDTVWNPWTHNALHAFAVSVAANG